MEVRIIEKGIVIFEEGSQKEVVRIPLAGYDVIELFYLREIYKTLVSSETSNETRLEINSACAQICEVLAEKLYKPDLGLVGINVDLLV